MSGFHLTVSVRFTLTAIYSSAEPDSNIINDYKASALAKAPSPQREKEANIFNGTNKHISPLRSLRLGEKTNS